MPPNEPPIVSSAGWYWQTDSRYRLVHLFGAPLARGTLGRRPWDLPGLDTRHPDWAAQFDALIARRAFHNLLWRRIDAAGCLRQCLVSGEPMFGPKGRFLGFRGVGQHAGEPVQADRSLLGDLDGALAMLLARAARARELLPTTSPARALIDDVERIGQQARLLCGRLDGQPLVPGSASFALQE